jgi:preprotein translocase subunit SecA
LQGVQFELWRTYGLVTLVVPPRLPSRLQVPAHRHFANAQAKRDAIIQTVLELHDERRAVLVGTRRIDDSEDIAQALAERGIECAVLNARQHEHEAKVIAAAGEAGRVTVATNMAGRGTDILLSEEVLRRGGLHVLMLEPHESARVDWQLFGRAGRQGSPGWAQPFASLEDDLIKRHVPWWGRPLRLLARTPQARSWLMGFLIMLSQWRAQRLAWAQRRLMRSQDKKLGDQLSFTHDPGRPGGGQSSA